MSLDCSARLVESVLVHMLKDAPAGLHQTMLGKAIQPHLVKPIVLS